MNEYSSSSRELAQHLRTRCYTPRSHPGNTQDLHFVQDKGTLGNKTHIFQLSSCNLVQSICLISRSKIRYTMSPSLFTISFCSSAWSWSLNGSSLRTPVHSIAQWILYGGQRENTITAYKPRQCFMNLYCFGRVPAIVSQIQWFQVIVLRIHVTEALDESYHQP